MTQALTTNPNSDVIESVITAGDLSKLNPVQRVNYYTAVCQSVGLNPLTKPFEYITLNGKMVLYARKDATDQLRDIRKVSVTRLERERIDGVYVVTAYAQAQDGRTDSSMGAVSIEGLKGDSLANALMKAETKAKRRVTLSICGLGMLDETELSTIPDARPANVNVTTGEVIDAPRTIIVERPSAGPAWTPDAANDAAFEQLPSASAERAPADRYEGGKAERAGGNGKQPPANGRPQWKDADSAIDWGNAQGCFDHRNHAENAWNKVVTAIKAEHAPAIPTYAQVFDAWYADVQRRVLDHNAKIDAALDAQAAGDEMPVFESR